MPKRTKEQGLNFLLEYVTCLQFGGDKPGVYIKPYGDTLLLIGADRKALELVSSKLTGGAAICQYQIEQPTAKERKVINQQISLIFNKFLPEPTTRRRLLPSSTNSTTVNTKLDTAVKPKNRTKSNKKKVNANLKLQSKSKTKNRSKP